MNRRDFLRILLASAVAEAVDVEQLLWTPKPIITVPGRVIGVDWGMSESQTIVAAWERVVKYYEGRQLFGRDTIFYASIMRKP